MKRRIGRPFRASGVTVYRAGAVRDATGINHRPGAIAVRNGRIIAVGDSNSVLAKVKPLQIIDLHDSLILPAFVNAHTHLALTNLGSRSYNGHFVEWLEMIVREAPRDEAQITDAVHHGAELCWAAGVGMVGDIAPNPTAIRARMDSGLPGVSYLEWFGIGAREAEQAAAMQQFFDDPPVDRSHPTVHLGIEPHAPYSAGLELYRTATRYGQSHAYRLTTHLAETREEIAFTRDGAGPLADMLKRMGKWDDAIKPAGKHPIDLLDEELKQGRWLLAHCNYVDDAHIERMARHGVSVAYCPIASEYFGHENHRYREMLEAGVNVCLGTDAIVCQPPHEPQPLSILAQMRWLYRRDKTDPQTLLKMATINGTRALAVPESNASLQPATNASLITIPFDPTDPTDPLVQVLESDAQVEPLMFIA